MKPRFKDGPKEWRKSALLPALGLAVMTSLLRWRHHMSQPVWLAVLGLLACVAVCAIVRPAWFRMWHRWTHRMGNFLSHLLGRVTLTCFFFLVLTPVGIMLRLCGQDVLQLKRRPDADTYWKAAKQPNSLERLF